MESESTPEKRVPRLGRWHLIPVALAVVTFTIISIRGQESWADSRGRNLPADQAAWNAVTIHTGPFAGVLYWDYGYHSIGEVIHHAARTRIATEYHRGLILIATPVFLIGIFLNAGIFRWRVRNWVRVVFGLIFWLNLVGWYFAAVVSLAMLA
ncbi:MAG: hypothetical protein HKN23_11690 [Verrucomicrobiales bacterium]|nr:hypothetical protein [Verrucomicrobiales bacterium]